MATEVVLAAVRLVFWAFALGVALPWLAADGRRGPRPADTAFAGLAVLLAVVTLRASLPVGENFQVFARLENLTDEHYATVSGYNSPGRSAYAGVRLRI